jgi:hypothetical protein
MRCFEEKHKQKCRSTNDAYCLAGLAASVKQRAAEDNQ